MLGLRFATTPLLEIWEASMQIMFLNFEEVLGYEVTAVEARYLSISLEVSLQVALPSSLHPFELGA